MEPATSTASIRKLRVLHVIPSLAIKDGGPTAALKALVRALDASEAEVSVLTTAWRPPDEELQTLPMLGGGVANVVYARRNIEWYKVSWDLVRWLGANVAHFDIVHIHALFSFSSTAAALICRREGIPYIVRPLGVLNRWGMRHRRRLLKALSYKILESRILRAARAIHFTSEQEAKEAEQLDPKLDLSHSIILPLPVEATAPTTTDFPFRKRFPQTENSDPILFLSRLDVKKGVEMLIDAFASVSSQFPRAILILAGDGDQFYVGQLKTRAAKAGIDRRILWAGFLSGEDKWDALSCATVFVLSSYSENFGIAAAEALAAGVPTILSDQVAVAHDARSAGAAIMISPTTNALRDAIATVLADPGLRKRLSENGRAFAARNFSPQTIGASMAREYRSLLH